MDKNKTTTKERRDSHKGTPADYVFTCCLLISLILAGFIIWEHRGGQETKLLPDLKLTSPQADNKPVPPDPGSVSENYRSYSKIFQRRDIFQTTPGHNGSEAAKRLPGGSPSLLNLKDKYKLIGILVDHDSQAVLENKKTHTSVFLSKGDALEGAVLKEINSHSVVFLYRGNPITLSVSQDKKP